MKYLPAVGRRPVSLIARPVDCPAGRLCSRGKTMVQGHEKRENARVRLDTDVRFSLDGRHWYAARSGDVSSTGMMLLTGEELNPGQAVVLSFPIPNLRWQEAIEVKAEVARVAMRQNQRKGVGLRFISLHSAQYQVLEDFVNRVLGLGVDLKREEMAGLAGREGYALSMDRLVRESLERQAEAEQRKAEKCRPRVDPEAFFRWAVLGFKIGSAAILLYLLYQLASFFIRLGSKVGGG